MNRDWIFDRCGAVMPAWYAAAFTPLALSASATRSVAFRLRQYTITASPRWRSMIDNTCLRAESFGNTR